MIVPDEVREAMTDGSHRFTDADVRANPTLLAQAVTFLQTYYDDWKPLRDARLMAVATGTLTVPVARMVLNCMRTNAAARFDNVVPIHAGVEVPPHQLPTPTIEDWRERKVVEYEQAGFVYNPDEPHWMNQARRNHGSVFTKFVPKMRFLVSSHSPAERRVWHLINTDACRIEWRDGEIAFYHIVLWCKPRPSVFPPNWTDGNGWHFARLPDERKICVTCPKHREESKKR